MNRSHFFTIDRFNLFTVIIISVIVIALGFLGEKATLAMRYERDLWQSGEWWRFFSGHFVHLSWTHLLLNLAGFWLIVFLYGQKTRPAYLMAGAIFLIAIGTSTGLFIFSPEVKWYVGLSGILHGLIVAGALKNISNEPLPSTFILAGIIAKIIWEQLYAENSAMEHLIGGNIVYDAHLYGAVSGAIIIALYALSAFIKKQK